MSEDVQHHARSLTGELKSRVRVACWGGCPTSEFSVASRLSWGGTGYKYLSQTVLSGGDLQGQ
jgi:hypothetical protein